MHTVVAIVLTELLAFSALLILFTAIVYQTGRFASDWEAIRMNVLHHLLTVQEWIVERFHISYAEQHDYLKIATNKTFDNGGWLIASTIGSVGNTLFNLFLIPVYVFLFLVYHQHLKNFWLSLFGPEHELAVREAMSSVRSIIQSYLSGLMIEMMVVAGLNATGLFLLGVNYAIFLGLLSAVLNLIPYIGTMIAGLLGVIVTLSSTDQLSKVVGVILVFWVVQLIDNNLLMPRIVGRKVKINALISILAVLIGGSLAGVSGMFLSIPTVAILKVIFDHADGLKPWGLLLGVEEQVERPVKKTIIQYILSSTWHPATPAPAQQTETRPEQEEETPQEP